MAHTTYEPLPDGRTKATTTYDDGSVRVETLPVVRRGQMPGAESGKKTTRSRGVDTGSLARSGR